MSDIFDPLDKPKRESTALDKSSTRTLGGLILVGVGAVLMLQQLNSILVMSNWWALFLLVPAGWLLSKVYNAYRQTGTIPEALRTQAIGGTVLLIFGFMLFFNINIDWGRITPVLMLGLGAWLLMSNRQR